MVSSAGSRSWIPWGVVTLAALVALVVVLKVITGGRGEPPPPGEPVVAVEIDDPTTEAEDFRTVRYGIFRTMSPTVRIRIESAAGVDLAPGQFQVRVDGGEDGTADELDISSLFSFRGGMATAAIPEFAPIDSLPGPNQERLRKPPDRDGQVRIMFFGENRLRVRLSGRDLFSAYFLHYDAFDKTVVGKSDGDEPVPGSPGSRMMTNNIILNFDPTRSDAEISDFLRAETLRPQGVSRDLGVVQARELEPLSGNDLLARIAELNAALGPGLEGVDIDLLTGDPGLVDP